ncbi:hypothetical protein OSTOST_17969 [Ostertagia ostertagi]
MRRVACSLFLVLLRVTSRTSAVPKRVLQAFIRLAALYDRPFDSKKDKPEKLWEICPKPHTHIRTLLSKSMLDRTPERMIKLPNQVSSFPWGLVPIYQG